MSLLPKVDLNVPGGYFIQPPYDRMHFENH